MPSHAFQGASRRSYSYMLFPWGKLQLVPRRAGNYILASGTALDPAPVWISQTRRLYSFFEVNSRIWDVAHDKHGASLFYVHIEASQIARLAEREDLVSAYQPPMDDRVLPAE
jgi:hypothetical protein